MVAAIWHGWHVSNALEIASNITLVPLPPKSPELNPVENVWPFIRDNRLSNRVLISYKDIVDHCCFAWNQLIDQPWKIMSVVLASGLVAFSPRPHCQQALVRWIRSSRYYSGQSPWRTSTPKPHETQEVI